MTSGRQAVIDRTGLPDLETWQAWRGGLPELTAPAESLDPAELRQAMRDALADAQHGQCALCLYVRALMVMDHDHESGKARGLLCPGCNTREGMTAPGASEVIDAYRANPPAAAVSW